jgi:hypothetical protein
VIAGIMKTKKSEILTKNVSIVAWFNRKRLELKNHAQRSRKTIITIYATGELKYPLNSFSKIIKMFLHNFLTFSTLLEPPQIYLTY